MSARILIKIITALVFAIVVFVPLFYMKAGVYPFVFDKALFFQALVEVLFGLWLVLVIGDKKYRPKWTSLHKSMFVFLGAMLLAAFFGVDLWRSFFSTYERAFGVFGVMHMVALALVASSVSKELPWKQIWGASVVTSVAVSALAIGEVGFGNLLLDQASSARHGSTFGNPTFLSSYLLWNIFLALYFLLSSFTNNYDQLRSNYNKLLPAIEKFFFSWPWLALAIVADFAVLVFVAQTRGNILGLAAGIFVLLVLFVIRHSANSRTELNTPQSVTVSNHRKLRPITSKILNSRRIFAALVVSIVVFGGIFWFTRANDFWGKIPGVERFRGISLYSEEFRPRFIALKAAWKGFLERPIFGWGPENFNIAFNKYYDPSALRANYQETRFDKPHNFLAEDLVTGGVVLVVAHLLFLAFFVFAATKIKDRLFGNVIIASTASYFVGNFFIFNTIGSDMIFYLFVGFLAGQLGEIKQGSEHQKNTRMDGGSPVAGGVVPATFFWAGIIASVVFAYVINIRTMQASYNHFYGFTNLSNAKVVEGVDSFRSALAIWSPYRWNFARDFAAAMSDFYFYNPELTKKEDVLEAIAWMERARDEHPLDAYNHYALVDMYNQVSDIDPEGFLIGAEREAKIALELSPNRQQVYFSLAKTKTLQGDYPAAIELARYGLLLDDRVADGHFYYGILLLAYGETETGYTEIGEAVKLGRKWKNFHEPLTIANLLADAGKINDAIELYMISATMAQGEDKLEVTTKLGIAYYFANRREDAKIELQAIAKIFDFRKSPSFENLKPILDDLGVVY